MEFGNKIYAKVVSQVSPNAGETFLKVKTDGEVVKATSISWSELSDISVFSRTVIGVVPAPGGTGTTRYLREDGTWQVIASGGSSWGSISGTLSNQIDLQNALNAKQAVGNYENAFTKNTGFNKNLGTAAGTVAEGNDSRINNGQTAFSWGNHSGLYRAVLWVPTWGEVTGKPTTFTPSAHSHSIAEITGLQTALDGKAAVSHTHLWAHLTDKPSTFTPSAHTLTSHSDVTITTPATNHYISWNGSAWVNTQVSYSELSNIPSTFAPSSHNHDAGNITSGTLVVARGGTGATTFVSGNILIGGGTGAITTLSRSGIDTRATFPATAHTLTSHSDVTVTTPATNQYIGWNGTVFVNRQIAYSELSGVPTTFAPTAHTHLWAQITDKPLTFAPSTHSHSWAEITSKPATFTPSAHTLTSHSDVTITTPLTNHYISWNGTAWVNTQVSYNELSNIPSTFTPSAHNHDAANITAGTLPVGRGGTGAVTHTLGNVLIGAGTGVITSLSRSGIDTRATFPATAHIHAATDIISGTIASARLTGTYAISISGNASTATSTSVLSTARLINGRAFDGSADIVTNNWGITRTITIGNTLQMINGSANHVWTLAQIGAADVTHFHDTRYPKKDLSAQALTDLWTGTQAQYDAIGSKSTTTIYFITN